MENSRLSNELTCLTERPTFGINLLLLAPKSKTTIAKMTQVPMIRITVIKLGVTLHNAYSSSLSSD